MSSASYPRPAHLGTLDPLISIRSGGSWRSEVFEMDTQTIDRGRDTRTEDAARLTSEQVWRALGKASFAVIGHVTGSGDPRSSGVVYGIHERRLYVAVAPDGWKAKQIAADGRVAMTVPVRRGGLLSLAVPIPPATISFHGRAIVHEPGDPAVGPALDALRRLLPDERRSSASVIEIVPEGTFVTYGLGIPLLRMRDPVASRARVAVS
jgi:Pyridoxamine 5'-phosphate oxidase